MRIPFRTGRIVSVLALLTGTLLGSGALAPPAQAAISFTKTVDKATASPGENVTYTLRYTCSITECADGRSPTPSRRTWSSSAGRPTPPRWTRPPPPCPARATRAAPWTSSSRPSVRAPPQPSRWC
ncbi:hypothetical protein GXW82_07425 [Streptacidiphilus sp. 4-A2]|nr:hypothetical protein [Streptacidiphilus sp. 4-A2]